MTFLLRDWIARISHVYREVNRLADRLANYAFSLSLGFHMCLSSFDVVNPILLEDACRCVPERQPHVIGFLF